MYAIRSYYVSKVEAVRGYGDRMKPLAVVKALWGRPAEVPAARIVDLVSPRTDGGTGIEAKVLTTRITSYNVCYTKLLRVGLVAGGYKDALLGFDRSVITSYSIHYTKLYD